MQLQSSVITLRRLRFYAYHGVMPQERQVGGHYEVSLRLSLGSIDDAVFADQLRATVNYAEVYETVKAVMAVPSELIEHVAGRILQAVFVRFRKVKEAEVTVTKSMPPMGADCDGVSVTLKAKQPFAEELKLLILDFDGTLAQTAQGIVRTMQATFSRMGFVVPDEAAICATIGLRLTVSIAQLAGEAYAGQVAEAVALYRQLFEEIGNKDVKAYPGVVETLAALNDRGINLAVATSRGHASVEALCRMIGIAPYLSAYVAEDDVKEKKPAPEAVFVLLERFGVRPSEAAVIGDTTFDIEMGRRAGCPTCGVTYGNHSRQQLQAAGADTLVDDFTGVMTLWP